MGRRILFVVLFALPIAACGDDESGEAAAPPSTEASSSETSPERSTDSDPGNDGQDEVTEGPTLSVGGTNASITVTSCETIGQRDDGDYEFILKGTVEDNYDGEDVTSELSIYVNDGEGSLQTEFENSFRSGTVTEIVMDDDDEFRVEGTFSWGDAFTVTGVCRQPG